jgi:arylsulfatase A-like enzyme
MQRINRRTFLGAAGATVLSAAAPGASGAPRTDLKGTRPNIIFILADDLGYGDLGCYGQRMIRTPHLDRMAREGIRFTDCYAGSTICAPSRCCLMTGYHTGHAYIRGNERIPLRPEDVTVAELLKEGGYKTAVIGKWGLGEPETTGIPNRKGFDYWFGYLNQTHAHYYYTDYLWRNEEKVSIPEGTYSHDLFTEEALQWVRQNREGPFFLYLAYTIPHALSENPEDGMPVPSDYPYGETDWPQNQKNHAAMITRMDRDIGRLLALLSDLGIDDRTLVLFSSDNGTHREGGAIPEFFNSSGPLRGIKRDLYEGGIRVPMIARWPGRIRPGQTSDQVWAFWDFLPTACTLAGVRSPAGIDGLDVSPALMGRRLPHPPLYWEFHEGRFAQAVRDGRWKAVRNDAGLPVELYDLKEDVGEQRDLAGQHPDAAARMAGLMEEMRTESEHWPGKKQGW